MKPTLCWLLSLLLSCLFILSACGGTSITTGETSATTLTAQDIIGKASRVDMNSAEFTVNLTTSIQGHSTPLIGTGKYLKSPHRLSMDLSMTYQGTAVTLSVVENDTSSYAKDSRTNQWTKSPRTDSSSLTDFDVGSPALVGKETINGLETYHVKGTDKDGNQEEYWFKTDNFFFVKGTFQQKGGDAPLTGTATVTNWNGKVTIAFPIV